MADKVRQERAARAAGTTTAEKHESSTAGAKAIEHFNVEEAIAFLKRVAPLRELLPNIDAKMGWVAGQAERIPKRGKNKEQGYSFTTESDIVAEVTKYAFIAGLSVGVDYFKPRFEMHATQRGNQQHVFLGGVLIVKDVVTHEEVRRRFFGYARDNGDKALWKGKTGLKKYAYAQTFGVVTGDDPEATPSGDEDFTPATTQPRTQAAQEQANRDLANAGQQGGRQATRAEKPADDAPCTDGQKNALKSIVARKESDGDPLTEDDIKRLCWSVSDGVKENPDDLTFGQMARLITEAQKHGKAS